MQSLTGKRIFYIEDDLMNRRVVKTILEYAGAVVSTESWGHVAVLQTRLVSFLPVDLILLDLMFPKNVSGYAIFDVLRSQPLLARIPIVAISASDPTVEVPKVRAKGFSGYIAKPIDIHSFPQQIEAILAHTDFKYLG